MGIGFSSFWMSAIPILILLLLVVLVVAFTRRGLADGAAALTPRRLVEAYIFCVVLISMILVSSGANDMIKAGLAHRYGLAFAYVQQPVWDENLKPGEKPKYEYDVRAPKRDLLSGTAQVSVGVIIGVLHLLGLRRLGRTESLTPSPVYRIFLIIGLVIYTSAVLIYAVGSIEDLLLYRYAGAPAGPPVYGGPIPGDKIAGLLGYAPLWGILVAGLFKYARTRVATARAEAL